MQACDLVAKREGLDDIKRLASGRSDIQIRAEYRQQAHLGDVIHHITHPLRLCLVLPTSS